MYVISSVIALEKAEHRTKWTGADERIRKRQFADIMRVVLKTLVFVGVSENVGKDSLPPSQTSLGFAELRLGKRVSVLQRSLSRRDTRSGAKADLPQNRQPSPGIKTPRHEDV